MVSLAQTSYATQFMCCDVASMCGFSLQKGVIIVAITTTVISALVLVVSALCISTILVKESYYNSRPIEGVNLIFSLYCASISTYQIVISSLLLRKSRKRGDIFTCSLWYVSHLSIILLYCLLFVARIIACFKVQQYLHGALTIMIGTIYEAVFIYFCIVVNSYSYTIEQEIYYY